MQLVVDAGKGDTVEGRPRRIVIGTDGVYRQVKLARLEVQYPVVPAEDNFSCRRVCTALLACRRTRSA